MRLCILVFSVCTRRVILAQVCFAIPTQEKEQDIAWLSVLQWVRYLLLLKHACNSARTQHLMENSLLRTSEDPPKEVLHSRCTWHMITTLVM